jgi:hypothetical protein
MSFTVFGGRQPLVFRSADDAATAARTMQPDVATPVALTCLPATPCLPRRRRSLVLERHHGDPSDRAVRLYLQDLLSREGRPDSLRRRRLARLRGNDPPTALRMQSRHRSQQRCVGFRDVGGVEIHAVQTSTGARPALRDTASPAPPDDEERFKRPFCGHSATGGWPVTILLHQTG